MTTQVSWNDGSSDKITLTYAASEGSQTVAVSSDAYAGYGTRTKSITFSTTGTNPVSATLTVTQSGKDIIIITYNDTYITSNEVAVGYEQQ